MAYDPMYEPKYQNLFELAGIDLDEWKYLYPESKQMMPRNMPEALVNYATIKAYVDANHTGNMANRTSHSGIIIYVNIAPIICYSKQHNTVDYNEERDRRIRRR